MKIMILGIEIEEKYMSTKMFECMD